MRRRVAMAALAACGAVASAQWSDNFNRPDGPIGGDWVAYAGGLGSFSIESNRGAHAGGADIIRDSRAKVNYDCAKVSFNVHNNGTGTQYVAACIGLGPTVGDNLFIKVQNNGGAQGFNTMGFYSGNNNGAGWAGAAPTFINLPTAFTDARVTVFFTNAGDTVNVEYDTNFDGIADQTHARSGVAAFSANFGQGLGLGAFGSARWDNWNVSVPGSWNDDFNRADGALGGPWVAGVGLGNFSIASNRGSHTNLALDYAIHGSAGASYRATQSIDIFNNGVNTQYVALMSGVPAVIGSNLFIKVQNNGGAQGFNTMGFYSGNNNSTGWAGAAPTFITLSSAFQSARVTVFFTNGGDRVNVAFDTDFDGVADQTYFRDGVAAFSAGFGTSFGVGAYGTAAFDNYMIDTRDPWSDDFNRAAGPIGGNWLAGAGNFANFTVAGGGLGAHTTSANEAIRHEFAASEAYSCLEQSVDIFQNGTGLQYVALVSGLGSTFGSNLYIKLQGAGSFTNIGFYSGLNNTTGWTGAAPTFPAVTTPFTRARMTVRFTNQGDTLILDLDTDFDGNPDQTYTRNGVRAFSSGFGTGFGVGAFGEARFDNWRVGLPQVPQRCYADCDQSTGVGVLDIFDFLCFQNEFAAAAPYACECDTSTGSGVCDIFDFLCFQNAFASGCP